MILSISRRTDIPAFYSKWLINCIREGFVMVRNPMNYHAISKIDLNPQVVDCIVFWSKNPQPLFQYLDELDKNYQFYFQYTINAYGRDLEPNLPTLDERIENCIFLSKRYGNEKVIWRYDPIILTDSYTIEWHLKNFETIAHKLSGYVKTCVFSFVDVYDKNRNRLSGVHMHSITREQIKQLSTQLNEIAKKFEIKLKTCCETIDLSELGVEHSCCIDPKLISKIIDCQINVKKDKNQRASCGCAESIDIGQYNTCQHDCVYCYANYNVETVKTNCKKHISTSPLLLGEVEEKDKINSRKVESLKQLQTNFFNI